MAAQDQHVGVWALTLVRRITGQTEYVYAGALVPADASPGEIARLTEDGAIRRVKAGADPTAVQPAGPVLGEAPVIPAGIPAPGEPLNPPAPDAPSSDTPARPNNGASKDVWVAYAVAVRPLGQTEDEARSEAEGLSRDKLAARYQAAPAA